VSTLDTPSGPSNTKVPSQLAVYSYIKSHAGTGTREDSDATKASQSTVDLTETDGAQIDVTGVTTVNHILMEEGDERIIKFTGALTLTHGADLLLPGEKNITTEAGGWAIVTGGTDGLVTTVKKYFSPSFAINYGGDFYTGGPFYTGGSFEVSDNLSISGNFQAIGGFYSGSTVYLENVFKSLGGFEVILRSTANTDVTLPTTGTVEGRVSAPATAVSAGVAGQVAYDATHEYRCISANSWVRVSTAAW
jgi:hypothetical protein